MNSNLINFNKFFTFFEFFCNFMKDFDGPKSSQPKKFRLVPATFETSSLAWFRHPNQSVPQCSPERRSWQILQPQYIPRLSTTLASKTILRVFSPVKSGFLAEFLVRHVQQVEHAFLTRIIELAI